MALSTIVVAVDDSLAAAAAAEFGLGLARATGRRCQLVHAVRDPWAAALVPEGPAEISQLTEALYADARARIKAVLQSAMPAEVLDDLIVQAGTVTDVVSGIVRETHADMVIVGGKHHSLLGRWLSGSTALMLARTMTVPLLVTAGGAGAIRRILVALDLSGAARPTMAAASALAEALGAAVRAVSVLEPLPVMPESTPPVNPAPYLELGRETIEAELRPIVGQKGVELAIRTGPAVPMIEDEARSWGADLVVVGSHGKNWTQRLMLGSVTERLLNHLPASLLVVPVAARQTATAAPAPNLVPAIG